MDSTLERLPEKKYEFLVDLILIWYLKIHEWDDSHQKISGSN